MKPGGAPAVLPKAWGSPAETLLTYLAGHRPGIRRIRQGRGFVYRRADGKPVAPEDLVRIRALVLPPAWTDVWISPSRDSHLQATGRDARGRKQHRYHDLWRLQQEQTKFEHLEPFAKALPRLRARVRRDLHSRGLTREKVLATVVRLLDTTYLRVGNDEYARENGSYGLTTLRNRHVDVQGSTISFSFRGKSGKTHRVRVNDARLARIVQRCQDLPGQELFEFVDENRESHPIGSREVNDYLRSASGTSCTAKDFRTWHGTNLAVAALARRGPAATPAAAKRDFADIVREVAAALGNTPAVCRKSYIHPAVADACERREEIPPPLSHPTALQISERRTLALLRQARRTRRHTRKGRP